MLAQVGVAQVMDHRGKGGDTLSKKALTSRCCVTARKFTVCDCIMSNRVSARAGHSSSYLCPCAASASLPRQEFAQRLQTWP